MDDEARWVPVCHIDDVPKGELRTFAVQGLTSPVLIANVNDRFFASASRCPHGRISLLAGHIVGHRIVCPGHAYEFDLATGKCADDATLELPRYRTVAVGGVVRVDIRSIKAPGL